jgi:hypothetical protein
MAQTGYSRRAIIGTGLGVTATLAGCLGQGSDSDPESPGSGDDTTSGASCDGVDGALTDIAPDTDEYPIGTTETFTDNAPFGVRSAIQVYPNVDGGKYEFLVIEFSDAETASNTRDEVLAGNDFGQIGYVVVDEYFVGAGGPKQEPIRSLMEASSLDSACAEAIQFA